MEYVLKIDLDVKLHKHRKWLEAWKRSRIGLYESLGLKVEKIIVKPSRVDGGRGVHAWIYVVSEKPLSDRDLCWLQLLGGDDPTRFRINMMRVRRGFRFWNKLFSRTIKVYRRRACRCRVCKIIRELGLWPRDL